jgi:hypothetical protein
MVLIAAIIQIEETQPSRGSLEQDDGSADRKHPVDKRHPADIDHSLKK